MFKEGTMDTMYIIQSWFPCYFHPGSVWSVHHSPQGLAYVLNYSVIMCTDPIITPNDHNQLHFGVKQVSKSPKVNYLYQ